MRIEQPTSAVGSVTAGALTVGDVSALRFITRKFSWTNAMVAGLTGTTDNLAVCTLPAKTVVTRAIIVITGQAATLTAVTVSLGRVATAYIDYVVASNAKAAANTIYGDAIAEVGAGLSAILGDLPSLTGTTVVNLQFVSSVEDLSTITASSGYVILQTVLLP